MWNIKKNVNINEGIREREIRLLDGKESTIIDTKEALVLADEKNMDLVMVSPTAKPPVCRIMDYNKFLYEQSKKQKEAKKNQKTLEIKKPDPLRVEEAQVKLKAWQAEQAANEAAKIKAAKELQEEMDRQAAIKAMEDQAIAEQRLARDLERQRNRYIGYMPYR